MDIAFINEHTVKPQFVAGNNYKAIIAKVEDKASGITLGLRFEDISVPAYWHLNISHTSEVAKRIAMDDLKGIVDMIETPVATSADLVGKEITVRLTAQTDSNLPSCGLPLATTDAVDKLF
jgi:hypothetical protein